MATLSGPSPLGPNGQITIPKPMLIALGWQRGDGLMFRISPDDPEVVTILPLSVAERRYQRGESIERIERMTTEIIGREQHAPNDG